MIRKCADYERRRELLGIRLRISERNLSDLLFFSVFVLAYRLLLDASYYRILSPVFGYYGFTNNISFLSYIVSW